MSNPEDAASRLSSALDEVFSGEAAGQQPNDDPPTADWSVDDESPDPDDDDEQVESYELPQIVPATSHVPTTEAMPVTQPTLPVTRPAPTAPVVPTVTPTPQRAPQPAAEPVSGASSSASPPAATTAATGWGDHMGSTPMAAQTAGLRSPGRRPRVRRVTRVLRHIDPWSTFKVALLFSAVGYVVMLTSGVLLWRVADSTGTLDNVERWFTQFGWETFELKGGEIFHNAWIIGLFGAVALTGALVLLATLFNLVSDIVGGIRVTVLEEEVVERTVSSTRRYIVRRPPVGGDPGDGSVATDWDVDGDDEPAADAAPDSPASTDAAAADWSVDDD